MVEEWRPTHHPNYDISSLGRVRSRAGKIEKLLKPGLTSAGYPSVVFGVRATKERKRRTQLVHRLVAVAFLGPIPEGQEVRHKDGDPLNPAFSNLEYGTHTQNAADMVTHNRSTKGERQPNALLTEADVRHIRTLIGKLSHAKIAAQYRVFHTTISAIASGRSWAHVE